MAGSIIDECCDVLLPKPGGFRNKLKIYANTYTPTLLYINQLLQQKMVFSVDLHLRLRNLKIVALPQVQTTTFVVVVSLAQLIFLAVVDFLQTVEVSRHHPVWREKQFVIIVKIFTILVVFEQLCFMIQRP